MTAAEGTKRKLKKTRQHARQARGLGLRFVLLGLVPVCMYGVQLWVPVSLSVDWHSCSPLLGCLYGSSRPPRVQTKTHSTQHAPIGPVEAIAIINTFRIALWRSTKEG